MSIARQSLTLLKIAVTVGALAFLLRTVSAAWIGDLVAHADPLWLALGALAALVQLLAAAWRWQLLHQQLSGVRISYSTAFHGFCRGTLFGQLLPSSIGSDTIRVVSLLREAPLSDSIRSVVCDRLLGLSALLLIVTLTLPWFFFYIDSYAAFSSLAAVSILGLAVVAFMMIFAMRLRSLPVVGGLAPFIGIDLRKVVLSSAGILPTLLAFLSHALSVVMFAAMARSIGSPTSLLLVMLIVLPAMLISSLPISLGGWGVREAVIASTYGMIGGSPAAGVGASLLFGLSSPILCALIEVSYALLGRKSMKRGKAAPGAT